MNEILNVDCLQGLKGLEDNSVDLIVTSPPYNIGKSSGNFAFQGYDIHADKMIDSEYDQFIDAVLMECYRVLKPEGSLLFNHKVRTVNFEAVHPIRHINNSEFTLKQEIVWDRSTTHQTNMDRFFPINEMIYWCVKDKRVTKFNRDSAKYSTVWRINIPNKRKEGNVEHPAPFPLEIAKRGVETFTQEGDVVLDPFMGSGTTAVAAKMLGRNYIGFELSEAYIDIANKRIAEAKSETTESIIRNDLQELDADIADLKTKIRKAIGKLG